MKTMLISIVVLITAVPFGDSQVTTDVLNRLINVNDTFDCEIEAMNLVVNTNMKWSGDAQITAQVETTNGLRCMLSVYGKAYICLDAGIINELEGYTVKDYKLATDASGAAPKGSQDLTASILEILHLHLSGLVQITSLTYKHKWDNSNKNYAVLSSHLRVIAKKPAHKMIDALINQNKTTKKRFTLNAHMTKQLGIYLKKRHKNENFAVELTQLSTTTVNDTTKYVVSLSGSSKDIRQLIARAACYDDMRRNAIEKTQQCSSLKEFIKTLKLAFKHESEARSVLNGFNYSFGQKKGVVYYSEFCK